MSQHLQHPQRRHLVKWKIFNEMTFSERPQEDGRDIAPVDIVPSENITTDTGPVHSVPSQNTTTDTAPAEHSLSEIKTTASAPADLVPPETTTTDIAPADLVPPETTTTDMKSTEASGTTNESAKTAESTINVLT